MLIRTDYLVIGAGAASLSFVDTLLSEQPNANVVVVDKHAVPGGHWSDAYGYVRLHQPSLLYGVASRQLEGNWLKLLLTRGQLPWRHRASKNEILEYYQQQMETWVGSGRVKYFPSCEFDFSQYEQKKNKVKEEDLICQFHSLDKTKSYDVQVNVKLVNGVMGECVVPSTSPVQFPVDEGVNLVTPNDLHDDFYRSRQQGKLWKMKLNDQPKKKYVVLGCGKTAMDTIVFLQREMGVDPAHISWVIPSDVWMLRRDGQGSPNDLARALMEKDFVFDKAALLLESQGKCIRLDKSIAPTRFRFPLIGDDEFEYLKKVKSTVRRGRVTAIHCDTNNEVRVEFGPTKSAWNVPSDRTFIHCTSPGPFNSNMPEELFSSDKEMTLAMLMAPPVPISMSCLAMLESARRNETLNVNFGRTLLHEMGIKEWQTCSDNDVLKHLVTGYLAGADDVKGQIKPIKLLALFFALADKDPTVGYNWMKRNRLSFFSIPGFKGNIYENAKMLAEKSEKLGYSMEEANVFALLADHLRPLEGK